MDRCIFFAIMAVNFLFLTLAAYSGMTASEMTYCIEWGVKLYSNQPTNLQRYAFLRRAAVRLSVPSINSRYFDSRLPAIDQYLPASDSSSGQRLTLRTDGRGPTQNCYDTVVLLVV